MANGTPFISGLVAGVIREAGWRVYFQQREAPSPGQQVVEVLYTEADGVWFICNGNPKSIARSKVVSLIPIHFDRAIIC
jgi:hypothetical protein